MSSTSKNIVAVKITLRGAVVALSPSYDLRDEKQSQYIKDMYNFLKSLKFIDNYIIKLVYIPGAEVSEMTQLIKQLEDIYPGEGQKIRDRPFNSSYLSKFLRLQYPNVFDLPDSPMGGEEVGRSNDENKRL